MNEITKNECSWWSFLTIRLEDEMLIEVPILQETSSALKKSWLDAWTLANTQFYICIHNNF